MREGSGGGAYAAKIMAETWVKPNTDPETRAHLITSQKDAARREKHGLTRAKNLPHSVNLVEDFVADIKGGTVHVFVME